MHKKDQQDPLNRKTAEPDWFCCYLTKNVKERVDSRIKNTSYSTFKYSIAHLFSLCKGILFWVSKMGHVCIFLCIYTEKIKNGYFVPVKNPVTMQVCEVLSNISLEICPLQTIATGTKFEGSKKSFKPAWLLGFLGVSLNYFVPVKEHLFVSSGTK